AEDGIRAFHVTGVQTCALPIFYGRSDDEQSIDVIHRALDLGIRLFDTADMYGRGHNESLLGRALQGRREAALVATKFAVLRGERSEERRGGGERGVGGRAAPPQ